MVIPSVSLETSKASRDASNENPVSVHLHSCEVWFHLQIWDYF